MKKIMILIFFLFISAIGAYAVTPTPLPTSIPISNPNIPFFNQANSSDNCGNIGTVCCLGSGPIPKITNNPVQAAPIVGGFVQTFIDFYNNTTAEVFSENSIVGKVINWGTRAVGGSGDGAWCKTGTPSEGITSRINLQSTCTCIALGGITDLSQKCMLIRTPAEQKECQTCVDPNNPQGFWTAIGCVSLSFEGFISNVVFKFGLGLAGVTAFGCIIYSAISLQLSQGSPDKIKKSQEMLTSCILGLVLIIFSVFILRTIGVTILQIPGLK